MTRDLPTCSHEHDVLKNEQTKHRPDDSAGVNVDHVCTSQLQGLPYCFDLPVGFVRQRSAETKKY